jgi:mRNA deadenylase 3'-5' endonuclease subunit Ccr4
MKFCISLLGLVNLLFMCTSRAMLPTLRNFIPIETTPFQSGGTGSVAPRAPGFGVLRVLQFNVLADGLSGINSGRSKFKRADRNVLVWQARWPLLLHEITQYHPDVMAMQEVDRYYDFFLPALDKLGYDGYFAPKPISAACPERPDGCAIFVKRDRLKIISSESMTLALSKASQDEGELQEEDVYIRAQNQVALISALRFVEGQGPSTPIILGTTHLKSSKSGTGERYRKKEMLQLLDRMLKVRKSYEKAAKKDSVVVLAGCFNTLAEQTSYAAPLTYRTIKGHRLGLRSVYTEDLARSTNRVSGGEIYTTWKSKLKGPFKRESLTKGAIDYIFYSEKSLKRLRVGGAGVQATVRLPETPSLATISLRFLLRSIVYVFGALIASASVVLSDLAVPEEVLVVGSTFLGLLIFEYNNYNSGGSLVSEDMSALAKVFRESITFEDATEVKVADVATCTSEEEESPVASIGAPNNGAALFDSPSLKCVRVLDVLSPEEVEPDLLPNERYPSDHLALVADLEIVFDT